MLELAKFGLKPSLLERIRHLSLDDLCSQLSFTRRYLASDEAARRRHSVHSAAEIRIAINIRTIRTQRRLFYAAFSYQNLGSSGLRGRLNFLGIILSEIDFKITKIKSNVKLDGKFVLARQPTMKVKRAFVCLFSLISLPAQAPGILKRALGLCASTGKLSAALVGGPCRRICAETISLKSVGVDISASMAAAAEAPAGFMDTRRMTASPEL